MWYNKGERRGKYGKIHSENGGKEGEKSPMYGDGAGDGRAEGKGGETEKWLRILSSVAAVYGAVRPVIRLVITVCSYVKLKKKLDEKREKKETGSELVPAEE